MPQWLRDKRVLSWGLYDWANSAFATTVMAGFFPVFFKEFWSAGAEVTTTTFRLSVANSGASLAIALAAPILGAIADRGSTKKRFLSLFMFLGVAMTAALFLVQKGQWELAVISYAVATVGFAGANIFYDSLITGVADESRYDRVSAFGFALGYLGGGLLFALNVVMTLNPSWFGLADSAQAVRVSFLTVAVWWAVFSLPVLLFVPEPPAPEGVRVRQSVRAGLRQLADTFREIRAMRVVFTFLIAYWLYIDGVHTVIKMAVDYGLSLGFDRNSLIAALLITQFVGFPAAIVFGRLGERFGPKTGVSIGIGVYLAVTIWAVFMDSVGEFYALAVTIGLVQGGVQSLSRSIYARIIPANKSAEFFGFYGMMGKFAAILGPVLMGGTAVLTGSTRLSILAVGVLFIAGGIMLWKVDVPAGRRYARRLEEV